MAKRRSGRGHLCGGDWTDEKLRILSEYLQAYTTALKKQPFTTGYIDAFAGTGYRGGDEDDETTSFSDLAAPEPQRLLDGSARLALQTEPRFNRYIFIEKSVARCAALERLKTEFPHLARDIKVEHGDANTKIQAICRKTWTSHRAEADCGVGHCRSSGRCVVFFLPGLRVFVAKILPPSLISL